ncbi:MAG TPA: PHP domain-containing protein, partial [bacterium]|nr:PHP domain-containing protein [bacterium]
MPLHVHTEYSLLDGVCFLSGDGKGGLIRKAKDCRFPAIAITDHGNVFGLVEFFQACKKAEIKPIIGCEMYQAPRSIHDRVSSYNHHLTVLARNEEGYRNLIKLSSQAWLDGFYYKPRIDKKLLEKHREGLIILSGCLQGEIPQLLLSGRADEAESLAAWFKETFEHFYLELMDHGLEEQKKVITMMLELGKKLEIPVVATQDVHYVEKEDAYFQDIVLCIGTKKKLADKDRLKFSSDQFYLKDADEMKLLFREIPSAVTNTLEIAEKTSFEFRFDRLLLPRFPLSDGKTAESELRKLCDEGIGKFYGENPSGEIRERLEHEMKIIKDMGFSTYFLIVHDFVRFAKNKKIPVGPG